MVHNHIKLWRGDYYDGYLWYPADEDGLLIKINVETGEVDYALTMLMTQPGLKHAYHQIVATGDGVLWAIPGLGDRILRIDLISGEQELIDFPDSDRSVIVGSRFASSIKYKEKIYCFPGKMGYILQIDTQTKEVYCIDNVMKEMERLNKDRLPTYFLWGVNRSGNVIYALGALCNQLLELNLDTKEYVLTDLYNAGDCCGYNWGMVQGSWLYFVNRDGNVGRYDLNSKNNFERIALDGKYSVLCEVQDGIVFVPLLDNHYVHYNVETGNVQFKEYLGGNGMRSDSNKFKSGRDVIEYKLGYFIVCSECDVLTMIDKRGGGVRFIKLKATRSLIKVILEKKIYIREERCLFSDRCIDLKCLIEFL